MEKISLIDYLDKKVKKWWDNPEITNALLEDRKYHLSHLELERVGSLTMTEKTANSPRDGYQSSQISVIDFYQEKYGIELKHPEFPLFTCNDGLDAEYPAELIYLEIMSTTPSSSQEPVTIATCRTEALPSYLTTKVGGDWTIHPQQAQAHLQNIDFYLSLRDGMHYGNLGISEKKPTTKINHNNDIIPFHKYFEIVYNYKIEDLTSPLITVNSLDCKKYHWPAELIFVVLY